MKNRILVISILTLLLTTNVLAVGPKGSSDTTGRPATSTPATGTPLREQTQNQEQVQTQQQTQTSNEGEEKQLRIETREETQNREGVQPTGQTNAEQHRSRERVQPTGQTNAEQHRSKVGNFMQSLLDIAKREGGIGQQLRVIAQEQNQSAIKTVQAMEKIQTRSKIKTFLFGTDYKNLGTLRSELVQTRNRIEQLKRLMERVENEGNRTELQNQIQVLEQEQARIENFIREQEGKFSLFGWLVKWLSGYKSAR